jgi:drug/metabolite transporter (DMT)-like permease
MGIGLGLLAALCWGFSDVFSTVASRRTGALRSVLGFHVVSAAALAIIVFTTGGIGDLTWEQGLVLFLLGIVGWVFYLAFYKALQIGPISIVSPIVSGYGAVMVVLAVLLLDERPSGGQIAAVVVAFGGVILACSDPSLFHFEQRRQALGIVLAIIATIGVAVYVFGVSYYSPELGWLVPIFLARISTTLFIVLTALPGGRWRFPDLSLGLAGIIVVIAVLDTAGFVSFNVGVRNADTSVVATAAAPYAIVPILFGVLTMDERPKPYQWGGIGLVLLGLVLLGLFS